MMWLDWFNKLWCKDEVREDIQLPVEPEEKMLVVPESMSNPYASLYSNLYKIEADRREKEWVLEKHKITRDRLKNPKSIWGEKKKDEMKRLFFLCRFCFFCLPLLHCIFYGAERVFSFKLFHFRFI